MSKLNNKGLTLIELLAVVVISSIFMVFISHLYISGLTKTKEIQAESALRDDADLIISSFIKEVYSVKQNQIVRNVTNNNGSYIEVSNDISKCPKKEDGSFNFTTQCNDTLYKIGFIKGSNGNVYAMIKDQIIQTNSSSIMLNITDLNKSSVINGNPSETSIYEVKLQLQTTYKRLNKQVTKDISFTNNLQPIIQ